jgi:hypothetical protein
MLLLSTYFVYSALQELRMRFLVKERSRVELQPALVDAGRFIEVPGGGYKLTGVGEIQGHPPNAPAAHWQVDL